MATARDSGRSATFASLENPTYRLLWLGGLVSFLAVQMEFIARGWLAYELTGSNAGLGAVFLGFGVPMLLLTPWGGVVADRLPKRKVLIACQLTLASSSAALAATVLLDITEYWMLIAAAVLQGVGFSFLGPARMAFTGELVGKERLANAIVLQQMSMNGTRVFGPSIAGALIGVRAFGVGGVYAVTACLLLVAVSVTFRLPAGNPATGRPVRSPFEELRDGVSYVRRRPLLRLLVLTSFLVVMVAFPYVVFLPVLASEVYDVGSSGYGVLSACSAVGALGASVFIASRADGPTAWRTQAAAGAVFALGVAVLGVSSSYAVGLLAVLVVGAASSGFQSLNNALVLSSSDPAYHGRVQSLMMLSFSGFGIAALPIGLLADAIGVTTTLAGMGAIALLAVVGYVVARRRIVAADPGVTEGRTVHVDDLPEAVATAPAGAVGVGSPAGLTEAAQSR